MSYEEYRKTDQPETWEQYRARHYRSQYMKAHEMLIGLFAPMDDPKEQFSRDMFARLLAVLVEKMWTPEVYLKRDYDKLQRNRSIDQAIASQHVLSQSGGPGQGAAAATSPPESSFHQQPQVSSRKPTQIDELKAKLGDLSKLLSFHDNPFNLHPEWIVIKPREYLKSDVFRQIAGVLKNNGAEYVSQGKESHFRIRRWEKQ